MDSGAQSPLISHLIMAKVPIFTCPKIALRVTELKFWDHFCKTNIPQKWWNWLSFQAFTTFRRFFGQLLKSVLFWPFYSLKIPTFAKIYVYVNEASESEKQKQFWNQWTKWNNLKGCPKHNSEIHWNKNPPTTTMVIFSERWNGSCFFFFKPPLTLRVFQWFWHCWTITWRLSIKSAWNYVGWFHADSMWSLNLKIVAVSSFLTPHRPDIFLSKLSRLRGP